MTDARDQLLSLAAAAVQAQRRADLAFRRVVDGAVRSSSGASRAASNLENALGDFDRAFIAAHPDTYPVPAPEDYLAAELAAVTTDLED